MASFGGIRRNGKEWRSMFEPATGVSTGMDIDEALEIVLILARECLNVGASYDGSAEALGMVENLRNLIEILTEGEAGE